VTDALLSLVTDYGIWALMATTFLSCLALPVPSSLAMLASGGFVAAGDLSLWAVVAAALAGAVLGDQTGFLVGRFGSGMVERLAKHPKRGAMLRGAIADLKLRGTTLVFFSRWLVSPLGPYVNFAAGAGGLNWRRFLLADLAGEAVWVTLYVGLGVLFAGNIRLLADLLGNLSGLLAATVVALAAGLWLLRAARQHEGR
jgi:membrane protein DedA with SNARE-associated domain